MWAPDRVHLLQEVRFQLPEDAEVQGPRSLWPGSDAWQSLKQGHLEVTFIDAPSSSFVPLAACMVTFLWHRSMTLGLFPQPLCPHVALSSHSPLIPQLCCQGYQARLELDVQKPFVM